MLLILKAGMRRLLFLAKKYPSSKKMLEVFIGVVAYRKINK